MCGLIEESMGGALSDGEGSVRSGFLSGKARSKKALAHPVACGTRYRRAGIANGAWYREHNFIHHAPIDQSHYSLATCGAWTGSRRTLRLRQHRRLDAIHTRRLLEEAQMLEGPVPYLLVLGWSREQRL